MVLGTAPKSGRNKASHKQARPSGIILAHRLSRRFNLGYGPSGPSSSDSVGHSFISTNSFGSRTLRQEVLNLSAIQLRQDKDQIDYQHHHDSITIDERTRLADIRADVDEGFSEMGAEMDIHDILNGDTTADISNAGSEFAELLAIEDGLLGPVSRYVTHLYALKHSLKL